MRTTKASRHREKILKVLSEDSKLEEDKWGNFKFVEDNNKRYHPKKTALNFQFKGHNWRNMWTAYYKDIEITSEGKLRVIKTFTSEKSFDLF